MAKGKEALASANRRIRQLEELVASLETQLREKNETNKIITKRVNKLETSLVNEANMAKRLEEISDLKSKNQHLMSTNEKVTSQITELLSNILDEQNQDTVRLSPTSYAIMVEHGFTTHHFTNANRKVRRRANTAGTMKSSVNQIKSERDGW